MARPNLYLLCLLGVLPACGRKVSPNIQSLPSATAVRKLPHVVDTVLELALFPDGSDLCHRSRGICWNRTTQIVDAAKSTNVVKAALAVPAKTCKSACTFDGKELTCPQLELAKTIGMIAAASKPWSAEEWYVIKTPDVVPGSPAKSLTVPTLRLAALEAELYSPGACYRDGESKVRCVNMPVFEGAIAAGRSPWFDWNSRSEPGRFGLLWGEAGDVTLLNSDGLDCGHISGGRFGRDYPSSRGLVDVREMLTLGMQRWARIGDGSVWYWGPRDNPLGRLGSKFEDPKHRTGSVEPFSLGLRDVEDLLMPGAQTVCAIGTKGEVWCWGLFDDIPHASPVEMKWANGAKSIALMARRDLCAVLPNRQLWCSRAGKLVKIDPFDGGEVHSVRSFGGVIGARSMKDEIVRFSKVEPNGRLVVTRLYGRNPFDEVAPRSAPRRSVRDFWLNESDLVVLYDDRSVDCSDKKVLDDVTEVAMGRGGVCYRHTARDWWCAGTGSEHRWLDEGRPIRELVKQPFEGKNISLAGLDNSMIKMELREVYPPKPYNQATVTVLHDDDTVDSVTGDKPIPNVKKFVRSHYGDFMCVLKKDDTVACIGDGYFGILGNGELGYAADPIMVLPPDK